VVVTRRGSGPAAAAGVSPEIVLSAERLTRSYAGRRVVDIERLEVGRGEVVAVLGPNGAGKSTLFRLLLLLERPDAGTIRLGGRAVEPGDEDARRRVAGVFQRPRLFSGSVRSNLEFGLRSTGVPAREWSERIDRTVAELGVSHLPRADVRTLSGGEAQRVALARALVLEPEVLLLDEPTTGLDVTVRRRFREELGRVIRERARSVVLITHDAADAFELADRVAVMEGGRIVQVGTPEDLTTEPATPFVAAFTGAELLLDGTVEEVGDGTLVVRSGQARLLGRSADGGAAVGDRVHVRYRPEDVVLAPPGAALDSAWVSARNRLAMTVRSTIPVGGLIRVRLDGPISLAALVTRDSGDHLDLRPGTAVTALLKTAALNVYLASGPTTDAGPAQGRDPGLSG
jgi:molybdate transport system ATP-binding protein